MLRDYPTYPYTPSALIFPLASCCTATPRPPPLGPTYLDTEVMTSLPHSYCVTSLPVYVDVHVLRHALANGLARLNRGASGVRPCKCRHTLVVTRDSSVYLPEVVWVWRYARTGDAMVGSKVRSVTKTRQDDKQARSGGR
jgi:hypothetical protein